MGYYTVILPVMFRLALLTLPFFFFSSFFFLLFVWERITIGYEEHSHCLATENYWECGILHAWVLCWLCIFYCLILYHSFSFFLSFVFVDMVHRRQLACCAFLIDFSNRPENAGVIGGFSWLYVP